LEYLNMDPNLFTCEAEVFNALAHPARLEILEILRGREACVCHIQAMSDQRQAYVSQHLNVLRQAGLVASRKDGQWTFYRASDPDLYAVIDQVRAILQSQGKLPPGTPRPADLEQRCKSCSCPQCAPEPGEQACIPAEVNRA
jgi:ArsR family transcriptional regulator